MEFIPENSLLKYNSDTLHYLRKQYGFDSLKRIDDAIKFLEEWSAKQEHFVKKSFDRSLLERLLIYNKGSVEKCKKKLDRMCTQRTLIPEFFYIEKIDIELIFECYSDALLSQLTPDHGRVHLMQFCGEKINSTTVNCYLKYFVLIYTYLQMKDYCNHVTLVIDWKDGSVIDFLVAIDISELRKAIEIAFEGFSMRMRAIHVVFASKTIEAYVSILKPLLGPKLGNRLYTHKTMDSVYEQVPRQLFPKEYGGNDKPLIQLREDLYNELHSPEFTECRRNMNQSCTNEALRQKDKFNEEYMGMSGTFRTLSVD